MTRKTVTTTAGCSFAILIVAFFCVKGKQEAMDGIPHELEVNAESGSDPDQVNSHDPDSQSSTTDSPSQTANTDISPAHPHVDSLSGKDASVAELDKRLNAYRQSLPLFADFKTVYVDRILPIAIQGEKAGISLREMAKQNPDIYKNTRYDKKQQQVLLMSIIAREYKDVYSQFHEAIKTDVLKLPDEQEAIYYNSCLHFFETMAIPIEGSVEQNCPFENGTVEYDLFMRDLGQLAVMATSPLGKMVYQIPAELQKEQQAVGVEYKEPYLQVLEEFSHKLGEGGN